MAYKINLSEEELKELDERMSSDITPKVYRRLQCIKLKNMKYKNEVLAEICSVHRDTITDWIKIFLNEGIEGLCELNYEGRRPIQLDNYKDIIINLTREGAYSTVMELKYILERDYGFVTCKSWLSAYLKKIRPFLQKDKINTRRR